MKIKTDFVTNSSSTAYVVFIPNRFQPSDVEIETYYNESCYDGNDDEKFGPKIHKEILEAFELLKKGEYLWNYGGDEGSTPNAIYYCILEISQKHGMEVASSEMGSEGNNTILGIKEEKIQDIMFSHIDMNEFFNTVAKGESVCCETKKDLP